MTSKLLSSDSFFTDALERIDLAPINRSLKRMAVASGRGEEYQEVRIEDLKIMDPQKNPRGLLASHEPNTNEVFFDANLIAIQAGIDDDRLFFLTIKLLTHELTHRAMYNEQTEEGRLLKEHTMTSGFRRDEWSTQFKRDISKKEAFYVFNEAVTEKIARQVFNDYMQAAGIHEEEYQAYNKDLFLESYNDLDNLLDAFIDRLAASNGVSSETVWEALIKGAFNGLALESDDIKKWIDDSTEIQELTQALAELPSNKGAVNEVTRKLR